MQKTSKSMSGHGITGFELTQKILQNLNRYNLKPTSKLVLLYLASCYNPKHGKMFPKQKTIALKTGVSEASVIRAISELHKEGLIISERKHINSYRFTSKIVSECPQEMQVNKSQSESLETCNLQPHDKEQITETNKEPISVEDYKILKEYAKQHNARNEKTYINWLIKSGNAKSIIDGEKCILRRANAMYNLAQENIKAAQFAKENAAVMPKSYFDNVRAIILKNKQ